LLLSLLIPLCQLWVTIHVKTWADFPSVIGGHVAACNFPLWRMGVSENEMRTGFSQCSHSFSNIFPWYLICGKNLRFFFKNWNLGTKRKSLNLQQTHQRKNNSGLLLLLLVFLVLEV
jgi:hypothetical protein